MPDAAAQPDDAEAAQQDAAQQSDLKERMDQALAGMSPADQPGDGTATAQGAIQPLDQAAEQQLRAVPDDPSGLLRARIHQYYARLRAAGQ